MKQKTEHALPRYSQDKPKSCEYCYFWGGKRRGCELSKCHYLLPEKTKESMVHTKGNCKGCAYGKHSPCIGYCLVKIMQEMKVGRYAE